MTNENCREEIQAVRRAEFRNRVDDLNALRQEFGERVVDVVFGGTGEKSGV